MRVLGLETSCDETAAAVVDDGQRVLSNVVRSQHDLHEMFGGVVPELASRAHIECLHQVVTQAVEQAAAQASVAQASRLYPFLASLDAIAVGNRPGLIGSLIVGVSAAKALAWSLDIPLIGIDHVQAHLWAVELRDLNHPAPISTPTPAPPFPALGLVVSGGHTTLYAVHCPTDLTPLGRTIDDAAGEAFDKAAALLDAGYPGGQALDRLAERADPTPNPNPAPPTPTLSESASEASGIPTPTTTPTLPRSLLAPDSLDFSFSGLKTALLYAIRGHPTGRGAQATFPRGLAELSLDDRAALAAEFRRAVVDVLITKLRRGVDHMTARGTPPTRILLGGGVTANRLLRHRALALQTDLGIPVQYPPLEYCVDNAAMIAGLAHNRLTQGESDPLTLPAMPSGSV